MGLKELIATSGGRDYETIRKGWIPTTEEKQARRLKDLQIDEAQQRVNDFPNRQQQKKESHKSKINVNEAVTDRIKQQVKKYKMDAEYDTYTKNHAITAAFIRGAKNIYDQTSDIGQARQLIKDNLDAVYEAGDDDADEIIDQFLSKDTSGNDAIKLLNNLHAILPSVQAQLDKESLYRIKKRGTSAWERLIEDATPEERKRLIAARRDKESGISVQDRFDKNVVYKSNKDRNKATVTMRGEVKKTMKRIVDRNSTIDEALQSMDAGNNSLSDKLLTSILTQLNDTDVRAMAMYKEFDSSFGNLFDRALDYVSRTVSGTRTKEQNAIIRDVLEKMKEYSEPAMIKMRQNNRALAKKSGLDPFKVVPPVDKFDIRDSEIISKEEKMRLLEGNPSFLDEL